MSTTTRRAGAAIGAALILALSAVSDARADSWTGADKGLHLAAGALISAPVTLATSSTTFGAATGCGVGVLKELADRYRPGHVASAKDAIVTCAGAVVGAQLGGFFIAPRRDGVTIGFITTL